MPGCIPMTCFGRNTPCADCKDNDNDGLIDADDPECFGPCDYSEGKYLELGIPGADPAPCHQSCAYDGTIGGGYSGCYWTCTLATLDDPSKCPPCTIVDACFKPCGRCKKCVGDPITKILPADCNPVPDMAGQPENDMGHANSCPQSLCSESGKAACGLVGCAPCPAGTYCITGCCQPFI